MAISSVLAPEKITGRQRPTVGAAQNFISGGSVLGSSVVSSAANKIVGFQRSAAVKPVIPDINSIISSISSNIVNTVNNSVSTSSLETNRNIENKIQNLKSEIVQVIKTIQNKIENISILKNQKREVINIVNQSNIENKKEIINQINNINSEVILNREEIINFITKSNIENKQTVLELINQNKKEIILNKTDLIDYINKTVLQSNVVNKVENLETVINQIQSSVSRPQDSQTLQPQMGGITTQLREVVQNIRENVNETVSKTITNLTTEYRKKVQEVDSAKPTGILQKFIDAYNTAFGFAQFFNNRKNISKLKDNLNAIKESFTESFSTARLLRQVIVKIVKQLSNLPKATSSGGGGFDIDVDIPGPRLKQSLPRSASRLGKIGKFAALGAGAVGAGVAGGAVVNALADTGQVQPVVGEPMIPGSIVDGFSAIVERFERAVEKLAKGATGKKKTEAKSKPPSGGGSSQSSSSSSGPPPTDMGMSDVSVSPGVELAGLKSNFAPVAQDILESGKIDPTKLSDRAAMGAMLAVGQMETNFSYDKAYSGLGGAGNNMQGILQLNRAYHKVSGKKEYLDYTIPKFQGKSSTFTGATPFKPLVFAEKLKNAKTGWDVANALKAAGFTANDFDPLDTVAEASRLTEDQVVAIKKIVFSNLNLQAKPSVSPNTGMGGPSVDPSQLAPEARSLLASNIAQPPPSQSSQPQVNILPMNVSGGQQSQGGGGLASSPPPQQPGPSVPFLPSGNPDNFLILYSKMVYNIVDG